MTKYVYSATGEKLRTVHETAAPNITVSMGTAHELTASELLYTDSTDYYLGGKLTMKNGRMDKYFFDGGYAQAKTNETTLTSFLVSPNGILQKYDPNNGSIEIVSTQMPSDPKDPDRKNNIIGNINIESLMDCIRIDKNISDGILRNMLKR